MGGKDMIPVAHKCKTVSGIRVKKLDELKAGPHLLAVVVREGILKEVTNELSRSQDT